MNKLKVPSQLHNQITSRMPEVEKAYSSFVITELPAGYDGEINEAYNNLILANAEITVYNILVYLKAKASLMKHFRTDGADLSEIYRTKIQSPSVAGIVLPEWVLSLRILFGILVEGLTVIYLLKKIFEYDVPATKISQNAQTIVNIRDVKQLSVIASNITRSRRKKKR